jgi:hypothetical protein
MRRTLFFEELRVRSGGQTDDFELIRVVSHDVENVLPDGARRAEYEDALLHRMVNTFYVT